MQMGSKQKGVVIISKIVEDLINEEKIANYFDLTLEEVLYRQLGRDFLNSAP